MAKKLKNGDDQGKGDDPQLLKAARRGAELRGNLKRRKSQSRARDETEAPGQQSRQGRKTLIDPV